MFGYALAAPSDLDAILASSPLDGAVVAATVTDPTGHVLYQHNGNLRVSPASNEKLFTAAFALYELGDDYHPVTRIWKQPGKCFVQTTGDPSLSHDQLATVATQLGLDGQDQVLVSEPYAPEIPEGWEIGDLTNAYAAPVAALSVDQAAFALWNIDGRPTLVPSNYGVKLTWIDRSNPKPDFSYDPIRRTLIAKGKFKKEKKVLDTLGEPSADEAAASLLGREFARSDDVPSTAPDTTIQGPSLIDIVGKCLSNSDNIMAENLLLMGAAHEGPLPEDCYPAALQRLREFEQRVIGISSGTVFPRDGSGLTRANLVTSTAVTQVLNYAASKPDASAWKNCLAAPGKGTLRSRLAGIPFQGKTGSLSHVTALSGYLTTKQGENLTISVIVNGYSCTDRQARDSIDSFVNFLYENGA
jgi:serine-type D-Ala-D-Ala carboxypeptidase/endopeptidase (penicillin-binding protein 4)